MLPPIECLLHSALALRTAAAALVEHKGFTPVCQGGAGSSVSSMQAPQVGVAGSAPRASLWGMACQPVCSESQATSFQSSGAAHGLGAGTGSTERPQPKWGQAAPT